jgi:hypothetical protein
MFKTLRGRCTVAYLPSSKLLVSAGHNYEFPESIGTAGGSPAPQGPMKSDVVEESNGNLDFK